MGLVRLEALCVHVLGDDSAQVAVERAWLGLGLGSGVGLGLGLGLGLELGLGLG